MSDDNKIDETLNNMGFSTMSEEEEKALEEKKKLKKKKTPKAKGMTDSEKADLRNRLLLILDNLPHPIESDIWATEMNSLQSQMRSCLCNEVFDRWVDYDRHRVFKVFNRDIDDEDEQMALMFPISLAMIIYNELYDPAAIEDNMTKSTPDLLEGKDFEKQHFFDLVQQLLEDDPYVCDTIHPHVVDFLDDVDINKVKSLVTEEQIVVAEILSRELLIRVYAEALAFFFKHRVTNGKIMEMLSLVILLAFVTNKYVTDTMKGI